MNSRGALVYFDALYNLDKDADHMIFKSNNFEPWRNHRIVKLCEEILPISAQRCIFNFKACVAPDDFVEQCVK